MRPHQLEHRPARVTRRERKDYGGQLVEAYNNEWESIRRNCGPGVMTPNPVADPTMLLRDVGDHIGFAIDEESHAVRTTCGDAGMMRLTDMARWIPAYQQIVVERDELYQQHRTCQERWRTKQNEWMAERATLLAQLQQLREARETITPPRRDPLAEMTFDEDEPSVDRLLQEGSPVEQSTPITVPGPEISVSSRTPLPDSRRDSAVMLRRRGTRASTTTWLKTIHRPPKRTSTRARVTLAGARSAGVFSNSSVCDTGSRDGGGCEPPGLTELPTSSKAQ
uniref:Uncharacterized protein n=1 Tax=Lygus hesperus TaxID=30085 RepID=A0A0K8SK43_LYGHE